MIREDAFVGATVAILLADVEGSTRMWESNSPRAAAAFARLDELTTKLVASHNGVRPLEQGEGDNLVAVFPKATDAVACALAIQRELHLDEDGLPLRIALHAGEAELRPDGKYSGAAFNRCARLRSLASGGQTLLSRPVYDLTADDLPNGVTLKDLGSHRLRDLVRPEHVFQLCHAELAESFPPLGAAEETPNNLPPELTTFIGRETELAETAQILETNRLVTFTGAGGCGKTRLALRLATSAVAEYPDGAWWIDLAPLSDPDLVPVTLASLLSVQEIQGETIVDSLLHKLSRSRALIVIDNCEHLIAASGDLISSLLRACPALTVVATSREPLGVEGEFSYRVPSLAVPEEGVGAETVRTFDAVRLFLDRAARVRSNFRMTEENADAVAEICRGLDGIPLAIELAAARMRALTAQRIAEGLSDRFRLLTGGDRSLLARQRTLEASVEWSIGLTADRERALLARLSVFAASFDLDAAEAVCTGANLEPHEVLDVLSNLVDCSLVQFEDSGAEPRYSLLETIRAYARERLIDSGEAADVRARHLEHYLALAERRDETRDIGALMSRLAPETDNLRAAMDWAQSSHEIEKGLRLAAAAWGLWFVRGNWNEVLRRLEAAVDARDVDAGVRGRSLYGAAVLCVYAGRMREVRDYAAQAAEIFQEIGNERRRARALAYVAFMETYLSTEDARGHAEEALRLAETTGDVEPVGMAMGALGFLDVFEGRWVDAAKRFAAAVEASRGHGIGVYTGHVWHADRIVLRRGLIKDARELFEGLLDVARSLGNATPISVALMNLSRALVYGGDYDRARILAEEGIGVGRESGTQQGWLESLASLGILEYALGNLVEAAEALERCASSEVAAADGSRSSYVMWLVLVAMRRGDLGEARRHLERARVSARAIDLRQAAQIHIASAHLARAEGDHLRADELAHEGLALAANYGVHVETADALELVAGLAAHFESREEAARLFGSAQRLREEIGYVRFPVEQPAYDEDVELARRALGIEEFEKAWAEGVGMSLEEAVNYAERGRGERKRPSAGWASLTPAELEVVRLTADGLTNPQIADRLFVSRHTVKVHLSHVFAKLGVSTRSELAAEATRRAI